MQDTQRTRLIIVAVSIVLLLLIYYYVSNSKSGGSGGSGGTTENMLNNFKAPVIAPNVGTSFACTNGVEDISDSLTECRVPATDAPADCLKINACIGFVVLSANDSNTLFSENLPVARLIKVQDQLPDDIPAWQQGILEPMKFYERKL